MLSAINDEILLCSADGWREIEEAAHHKIELLKNVGSFKNALKPKRLKAAIVTANLCWLKQLNTSLIT